MPISPFDNVAPRVGAWIETKSSLVNWSLFTSPLAWGRGLKHGCPSKGSRQVRSPLAWGRGLKRIRRRVIRIRRPQRGAWIETCVIRNFVPPKFRKVKQPGKGKVKQPTKYTIT